MTDIHSCSYFCDRPGCIKAQRDELRAELERLRAQEPVAYVAHCIADGEHCIEGEFDFSDVTEKPFEVIDGALWECAALYLAAPPLQPAQRLTEIERLQEELEQLQTHEPVGHIHSDGDFCWDRQVNPGSWPLKLYAAPQAQPAPAHPEEFTLEQYEAEPVQRLTDERVDDLAREMVKGGKSVNWLVRAIESAIVPQWQPIETAPEGALVVVMWLDDEDDEEAQRYDFDYKDDGCWCKHAEHVEWAGMVAPAGSRMPRNEAPYTHWMPLPAALKD